MRVLLLASAINGLVQRMWCALREDGHEVWLERADPASCVQAAQRYQPELVLCPHLTGEVPAELGQRWRTVVVHPGPVDDYGLSGLDRAILNGEPEWGVTALQPAGTPDRALVWATRSFPMPADPPRKSSVYRGPLADAAVECVREVVAKAAEPTFQPAQWRAQPPRWTARSGWLIRLGDRVINWADPVGRIVRAIRAGDGAPGTLAEIAGVSYCCFDAAPLIDPNLPGAPGDLIGRSDGSVLIRAGDGGVWIGQLRRLLDSHPTVALPAATVLADALGPLTTTRPRFLRPRVTYRRFGKVGRVLFDFYDGAMSTTECRTLRDALRHAAAQDTKVILLQSGPDAFCTGVHLGVVEEAADPTWEAWINTNTMDELGEMIASSGQPVVTALTGGAGAAGLALAFSADHVVARAGIVLNPPYAAPDPRGLERHQATWVGPDPMAWPVADWLPMSAMQAAVCGLVDAVGPRDVARFSEWTLGYVTGLAGQRHLTRRPTRRARRLGRQLAAAFRPGNTGELVGVGRYRYRTGRVHPDAQQRPRPVETPARLARHRAGAPDGSPPGLVR